MEPVCEKHGLTDWPAPCPECEKEWKREQGKNAGEVFERAMVRQLVGGPEGDELKPGRMYTDNESSALIRAMYEVSVMTVPTEEQLRDPAWWTLNAPSGCEKIGVAYIDGKVWSYEFMMPGVTAMTSPCNADVRFFSRPFRPEPTKEGRLAQHIAERDAFLAEDELQSQDWDEAGEFPPVDSKVLANVAGEWKPIVICGYGNRFCLGLDEDGADVCFPFNDDSFRPIRTEAEKQREEVIEAAKEALKNEEWLNISQEVEMAIEDLYDAGMLRKGES